MSLLHKELIFSHQRKRGGEEKLKDKEEQKLSNKGKSNKKFLPKLSNEKKKVSHYRGFRGRRREREREWKNWLARM